MRKVLLLFIIINFVFAGVVKAESVRPLWKDICPEGMENAVYKEVQWFWPEGTKSVQEIYNFWANKRTEFEDSLVICEARPKEFRAVCYADLKSKILSDAELYNINIQNKNMRNQLWKDNSRTSNPSVNFNF